MRINKTNRTWQTVISDCYRRFDFVVEPRGMEVREILNGSYTVPMPAYIDLTARKVNLSFMFAEAAWIISGSNRLDQVTAYMKGYKNFSDDGVFLKGAYGPKVVEQLPYILETLLADQDSRQAVMTIWRERPSRSKDVPCTVAMQFFIRKGKLYSIVTMRSNDVVLGFTYDVFTFSMVAKAIQLLLKEKGVDLELGMLTVNAGSLHLYSNHYKQVELEWSLTEERDGSIELWVDEISEVQTYAELIEKLKELAYDSRFHRG